MTLLSLYKMKVQKNKKNELGPQYPVLFVHGLFSKGDAWRKTSLELVTRYDLRYGGDIDMGRKSKEKGIRHADFYTITFSNPYDLSFQEQGKELAEAIEIIKRSNQAKKIIMVGHSMGGLAARAYLQFFSKNDVYSLITIGTPHYGAPMALLRSSSENWALQTFAKMEQKLFKMALNEENAQEKRGFFARLWQKLSYKTSNAEKELHDFFNSKAFLSLAPGSEQLEELNQAQLPTKARYIFIIGDVSYEPLVQSQLISGFRRKLAKKWSSFVRFGMHGLTKRTMSNAVIEFRMYCTKYAEQKNKEKLESLSLDSDGVVPVASQFIHHLPKKCVYTNIYFDSWHLGQMDRADKIFQALAISGAFR